MARAAPGRGGAIRNTDCMGLPKEEDGGKMLSEGELNCPLSGFLQVNKLLN